MKVTVAPSDTIRIAVRDLKQKDSDFVDQPVTGDLTGTLSVSNWETAANVSGPHTLIQSGVTDDWYYDLTAPAVVGRYRLTILLSRFGAQRTMFGELKVEAR